MKFLSTQNTQSEETKVKFEKRKNLKVSSSIPKSPKTRSINTSNSNLKVSQAQPITRTSFYKSQTNIPQKSRNCDLPFENSNKLTN